MNIIKQNPFRILGLAGNVTEKELQKQLSILNAYTRVGKAISSDYDFLFLGEFTRNRNDILDAAKKIELDRKRLKHSLFWFVKSSHADEIALSHLKAKNTEKACEIWEKTSKNEISNSNFTSYQNLSTLYFALSTIDGHLNIEELQMCILLKRELIYSDSFSVYTKAILGNNLSISKNEVCKDFIEEIIVALYPYLNAPDGVSVNILISLFNSFPKNIQEYLHVKFSSNPIHKIEREINQAKSKRKLKPENADKFGINLYKATITELKYLTIVIGNNVQNQLIVNKLADEIMHCSIDYYNSACEKTKALEMGNSALEVANYALNIEPSGQVKQKIEQNISKIKEWNSQAIREEKSEKIATEDNYINKELFKLEKAPISCSKIENIIENIKPKLDSIKIKLGENDSEYLNRAKNVLNKALNCLLSISKDAPKLNDEFLKKKNLTDTVKDINLEILFEDILTLLYKIFNVGISNDSNHLYETNFTEIKKIANKYGVKLSKQDNKTLNEYRYEIKKLTFKVEQLKFDLSEEKKMADIKLVELNKWKPMRTKKQKQREKHLQKSEKADLIAKLDKEIYNTQLEIEMLKRQYFLVQKNILS